MMKRRPKEKQEGITMDKLNMPNLSVLTGNTDIADESAQAVDGLRLPAELAKNKAFARIFRPNKLTFGLAAPFKGYPDSYIPDLSDLGQAAQLADKLNFSILWVRDVPFYDPNFGDIGQGLDPIVTLGYLAAKTEKIALGTAGLVAPLRSPVHLAKVAASMDVLTGGRFVLGLSGGDRPVEYPAFDEDFSNRAERFRENINIIRMLTTESFPRYQGQYYGQFDGNITLEPKPSSRMPVIAIGRARQELSYLANNVDAWIWHGVNPKDTRKIVNTIAELGDGETWHPFGYANFVELSPNPNAPARLYNNIYLRGGSNSLAEYWAEQKEQGLAHVTINLKPTQRPMQETLQDLAENVLSKF